MPSAFKSSPRHTINVKDNGPAVAGDVAALARHGSMDLGYDEDAFTRLKVAQDCLIEDLECKIVVSSVVGQSVLRGIVRALSDEAVELVSSKNAEVGRLEKEKTRLAAESLARIKESESSLLEKERDLSKMAETLIDLSFRLQGESINSGALEKKIKDVVAKDASKQRRIDALCDEVENLKMERETLKSEVRIKAARHSEQLEEVRAEDEAQLAALREESMEQLSTISALEKANDELCQMIEAQMVSIEELQRSLQEQGSLHEQEIDIIMDVYEGEVRDIYNSRKLEDQEKMDEDRASLEESEEDKHRARDETLKVAMDELEKDIILDCFAGFSEDVRDAVDFDFGKVQGMRLVNLLVDRQSGRQGSLELQKYVRHCKSRSRARSASVVSGVQERLLEQHQRHQLEMDVLLEFFVGKLQELSVWGIGDTDPSASEDVTRGPKVASRLAELQRENATLRREKDQVLVDKTEEMFRLKRDFFKELDKMKLEGGQYEFGNLKKQFSDSRQKLDRILDRRQSDSCQQSASVSRIDEQSDADSVSSGSQSFTNDFGRFTEDFPVLVSELQNDIEQLILDTGMAKPDDSAQRTESDIQHDYQTLNMEYESALRALEDERRQNVAFTVELQELEHNINLSNGELERLLKQIETEKQARMIKEGELQNVRQDASLIKRQLDAVAIQLENETAQKTRMESELALANQRLDALHKELSDVLKVKAAIAEDHKKLRDETISVHRGIFDIRNDMSKAIENQVKSMTNGFATVRKKLELKDARMRKLNEKVASLCNVAKRKDIDRKRKLSNYLKNLRRAEEEVDLLGDENDHLVNLLEKVFVALEHYSPALRHYPGIVDLLKLIKEELMGRVEH